MQDQGSPARTQEFRNAAREESRPMPRYGTEPKRESPKTTKKKPRRWAISELLVGSCPEFLEAFARTS